MHKKSSNEQNFSSNEQKFKLNKNNSLNELKNI